MCGVFYQKYLTPNDIDINKLGIQPDISVPRTEDDFKNKRDPQLLKAVDVAEQMVNGKTMKTIISENMVAELKAEQQMKNSSAAKPEASSNKPASVPKNVEKKPAPHKK